MKVRVVLVLVGLVCSYNLALLAQTEGSATTEGSASSEGSGTAVAVSSPVIVLTGLDPVSLIQGQRERGTPAYSRVYKGFEYRFADAENRRSFDADPDQYSVVNEGLCPVAQTRLNREIQGNPEIFAAYEGRIYLFGNQDALDLFKSDPTAFVRSHAREGSGSDAM